MKLKGSLYANIFNHEFITVFLHLPFSTYSQDTIRVCAAILAYLVRDSRWVKFQDKIVNATLEIVGLCLEESTLNYLVYVLKN